MSGGRPELIWDEMAQAPTWVSGQTARREPSISSLLVRWLPLDSTTWWTGVPVARPHLRWGRLPEQFRVMLTHQMEEAAQQRRILELH